MQFDDLVDTFDMLDDWEERYRYLIDLGRALAPMNDDEKTEASKVRGCMSQVWLTSEIAAEAPHPITFHGDSDAHIVKGLIAVLFTLYSGHTPDEILALDVNGAFEKLGLESHLSMNRRNGFYAMVERIRQTAEAAKSAR